MSFIQKNFLARFLYYINVAGKKFELMIRKVLVFLLVVAVFLPVGSCWGEETFDESLLYGRWRSGTLHYRYDSNGRGVSWDTADDVREEEGQGFSWELKKSSLNQYHTIEGVGDVVARPYTVTKLTETALEYRDKFRSYSFTKVN